MSIPIQAQEAFNHLLDWLKREPWKSRFHQFADETILELAEINEVDINELSHLAETQGWAPLIMRGITEYFAELLFETEPSNVVDDYLKRRGWKETLLGRQYLEALSITSARLYQVQAVVPGVSVTVQDLVEPSTVLVVSELLASQALQPAECLLAKVVEVQETLYFSGALFQLKPEDAFHWASEIQEILDAEEPTMEEEDPAAALLQDCRIDLLGAAVAYFLNPLPTITNTDGHLYLSSEIRFPLLKEPTVITSLLDDLPDFERENPEKPEWIWFDPKRSSKNQLTILGSVKLTGKWLKAEVNFKERTQALIDYLKSRLPEALGQELVT